MRRFGCSILDCGDNIGWRIGRPAAGKSLAQKWCAECHSTGGDRLSPNLAAPTFAELAAEPSITDYTLRAFLRTPHKTMPNITFTPDQMDDIVDYVISLKPHH
jgi:mono/diheme cytochrome c family protein